MDAQGQVMDCFGGRLLQRPTLGNLPPSGGAKGTYAAVSSRSTIQPGGVSELIGKSCARGVPRPTRARMRYRSCGERRRTRSFRRWAGGGSIPALALGLMGRPGLGLWSRGGDRGLRDEPCGPGCPTDSSAGSGPPWPALALFKHCPPRAISPLCGCRRPRGLVTRSRRQPFTRCRGRGLRSSRDSLAVVGLPGPAGPAPGGFSVGTPRPTAAPRSGMRRRFHRRSLKQCSLTATPPPHGAGSRIWLASHRFALRGACCHRAAQSAQEGSCVGVVQGDIALPGAGLQARGERGWRTTRAMM